MNVKEYFADKKYGFYVLLSSMLLSLITMIVYAASFGRTRYMSWAAFAVLLVGIVLAAVLIVFKFQRFAPALMFVVTLVALMLFIYYIYFFVSSVMTGIQFSGFPPEFFATVIFFALSLVTSIVSIFTPLTDKKDKKEEANG